MDLSLHADTLYCVRKRILDFYCYCSCLNGPVTWGNGSSSLFKNIWLKFARMADFFCFVFFKGSNILYLLLSHCCCIIPSHVFYTIRSWFTFVKLSALSSTYENMGAILLFILPNYVWLLLKNTPFHALPPICMNVFGLLPVKIQRAPWKACPLYWKGALSVFILLFSIRGAPFAIIWCFSNERAFKEMLINLFFTRGRPHTTSNHIFPPQEHPSGNFCGTGWIINWFSFNNQPKTSSLFSI